MKKNKIGTSFGTQYFEYYHDGKGAIKHLMKTQEGECVAALYHPNIGDIDIVWGENNENNKGYGLKHIIEKHGDEIAQLGFKVEDFIPIVVQFGELKADKKDKDRVLLVGQMFRVVIAKVAYKEGKKFNKTFVLTTFDLRPKITKNR